jgi:hypothetical protein
MAHAGRGRADTSFISYFLVAVRGGAKVAVVSTRDFRITVRGTFDGLTSDQRAELLTAAEAHDLYHAEFTPEGHLSYDIAARPAFTFRFLESGEKAEDVTAATERAEAATVAWLGKRGYAYKNLRSQATDMAEVPLSKRQRHAITKKR